MIVLLPGRFAVRSLNIHFFSSELYVDDCIVCRQHDIEVEVCSVSLQMFRHIVLSETVGALQLLSIVWPAIIFLTHDRDRVSDG